MVKTNKVGQAIGRKGRESRQRLLDAARILLTKFPNSQLSVSKIAREAGLASQTFYLYFASADDVLFELCDIASTDSEMVETALSGEWQQDEIKQNSLRFVKAFYQHWSENRSVLNYRNFRSDAGEDRFIELRHRTALPVVEGLAEKLSVGANDTGRDPMARAVIFYASMERLAGRPPHGINHDAPQLGTEDLIDAQADILAELMAPDKKRA